MIMDGKSVKNTILDELKDEVSKLEVKPKLVVIQIANDEASNVYIRQKCNMCEYVGYEYEHIKLDVDTTNEYVLELIDKLNNDIEVTGIMVQLPIPEKLDVNKIINSINPLKDVDGLTHLNNGRLLCGTGGIYSCTPSGIMELLDRYNISVASKHVVIVGRSNLVGKPMALMMLNRNATVTVCHSKTVDLEKYTKMADILVVAVGKPNLITNNMVRDGAVVIDVGINRTDSGLCGDVDFSNVSNKVSYITPVPGGVGPMTVAMLAKNICEAYKKQER